MKNYWLLAIGCWLLALVTGCAGADQAVKKGDKFYALGEYYDAANQYKKAYSQTPPKQRALRGKRALKMAECYRRVNYTQKAIAAYNNAVRYKQEDSLTHLYLGQQLMKNGSYKEAAKAFQTFLDSAGNYAFSDSRDYVQLARRGLRSAQQAPAWSSARTSSIRDGRNIPPCWLAKRTTSCSSPPRVIRPKATS